MNVIAVDWGGGSLPLYTQATDQTDIWTLLWALRESIDSGRVADPSGDYMESDPTAIKCSDRESTVQKNLNFFF